MSSSSYEGIVHSYDASRQQGTIRTEHFHEIPFATVSFSPSSKFYPPRNNDIVKFNVAYYRGRNPQVVAEPIWRSIQAVNIRTTQLKNYARGNPHARFLRMRKEQGKARFGILKTKPRKILSYSKGYKRVNYLSHRYGLPNLKLIYVEPQPRDESTERLLRSKGLMLPEELLSASLVLCSTKGITNILAAGMGSTWRELQETSSPLPKTGTLAYKIKVIGHTNTA